MHDYEKITINPEKTLQALARQEQEQYRKLRKLKAQQSEVSAGRRSGMPWGIKRPAMSSEYLNDDSFFDEDQDEEERFVGQMKNTKPTMRSRGPHQDEAEEEDQDAAEDDDGFIVNDDEEGEGESLGSEDTEGEEEDEEGGGEQSEAEEEVSGAKQAKKDTKVKSKPVKKTIRQAEPDGDMAMEEEEEEEDVQFMAQQRKKPRRAFEDDEDDL